MKAYSVDLRQKIIDTYENEKISQRQLAQRFRVTLGFIIKLLKQYRETGDISPKTSPGRPRQLNEEQMETVKALVEEQPDITLAELQAAVEERYAVKVSMPTMCRVLQRLQLSRKKKPYIPALKAVSESRG